MGSAGGKSHFPCLNPSACRPACSFVPSFVVYLFQIYCNVQQKDCPTGLSPLQFLLAPDLPYPWLPSLLYRPPSTTEPTFSPYIFCDTRIWYAVCVLRPDRTCRKRTWPDFWTRNTGAGPQLSYARCTGPASLAAPRRPAPRILPTGTVHFGPQILKVMFTFPLPV